MHTSRLPLFLLLALVFTAVPLSTSCNDRPRMEGCRGGISDFSGITSVEIVRAGTIMGFQGGYHYQFQIQATGTGLGTCVDQRSVSGTSVVEGGVRATVTGDSLLTSPILHFGALGPEMTVTTLGRTLTFSTASVPDAGADAGGRADAAGVDAP